MKKKTQNPAVAALRRIGPEAWLALRARQGAGQHKDKRTASRSEQRRKALDDQA